MYRLVPRTQADPWTRVFFTVRLLLDNTRDGGHLAGSNVSRFFIFYFISLLRKDTCPPNHINVTNSWKEEKQVRTGVGKD